jgi:hypothetical protein
MINKTSIKVFCLTSIIVGLFILGLNLAYSSNTQASSRDQDPLLQDAEIYASDQTISLDEAVRRCGRRGWRW